MYFLKLRCVQLSGPLNNNHTDALSGLGEQLMGVNVRLLKVIHTEGEVNFKGSVVT